MPSSLCPGRRFQTAHQLGVPTIVRGLAKGCDWDPECLMRACKNTYHGAKQEGNPEKHLQVAAPLIDRCMPYLFSWQETHFNAVPQLCELACT